MQAYEKYLTRWHGAGLLDDATAGAIRQYEQTDAAPSGRRWQVIVALVLGGILLGAGILLFVAAHWDDVSTGARLALVLGMLALFHGSGIAAQERFPGFATTMHALGTVSCGAAIALIGQIFNMQEHWPAAILLWAVCALAGWLLLGDQFQQTLTLLLFPAWILCEWSYRAEFYNGSGVYMARMLAVIAAAYLTCFLHSKRRVVFGILFAVGAVALAIATPVLSAGFEWMGYGHNWGFVPLSLRVSASAILALAMAFAWFMDHRSLLPTAVVAAMTFVLPWLNSVTSEGTPPYAWRHSEPTVLLYLAVAAVCVFLAWWGVQQGSKAIVNYSIAAFALTVVWFYFSDILGKLDRSLGLILLGILFLAGGWALEKTRRRLVAHISEVAA